MPVSLKGSTSGTVTLQATAVAGVNTVTVPAETGTMVTTASSGALPVSALATTGTPSASTYLNGTGAWATVASNGQLIRSPRFLTSGTSYTTPSNCTSIYVEAVGGGASGRGTSSGNSGHGGGAGGYCAKYFTVTPNTTYTYGIGAGGTGVSGNTNGNSGGDTTFTVSGVTITAGGGVGPVSTWAANGGTATNGDINISGGSGSQGFYASQTSTVSIVILAMGGNSMFGQGGPSQNTIGSTLAGSPGIGYGSGGSGGYSTGPSGAGAQGAIRIWEFT